MVVIDDDRQAGHAVGAATTGSSWGPAPKLRRESNVTRVSLELPYDHASGDFELCREGDLVRAHDARRAPARQLAGAKTRQDCELEPADVGWTLDHRTLMADVETLLAGADDVLVDMQPSQQSFGEGWAGMA